MQILSKIIKFEFSGTVTLELIENFFAKNSIRPIRWAITKAENGILTISYAEVSGN